MKPLTTFDSIKVSLLDLLRPIKDGKIQLPDFQRDWVWDDERIISILSSISLSYPIGTVMMLQAGGEDVRFKPRLVEGVILDNPPSPERLILDGQQRLTALFQSLYSGQPVQTKDERGSPIRRWYYINIEKALSPNADREEAMISFPEDRKTLTFGREIKEDLSSPEKEYQSGLFPLSEAFECQDWRRQFNKYWNHREDKTRLFDEFEKEIIDRFKQYQVPLIFLYKETPKEAVCHIFEKVNTMGVPLTVFDLLTATYAADDFILRKDWAIRKDRLKKNKIRWNIESTDFLQTVSLLATRQKRVQHLINGESHEKAPAISCKRKDILRLTLKDYKEWADSATEGFEKAAKFLYSQKIFTARDLPYRTQIIPLAATLAILMDRADNDGIRSMLSRWYWCGVFGELYGSAIETRFAKDLPETLAWIDGASEPSSINDANFVPTRLLTLRTRNSAAYKGLYALLIRDGGLDFRSGDPIDTQMYFDDKIDIHHIFPQDWCNKNGIDLRLSNCIVNKTPVSAKTNRMIGANPPSIYLNRIQKSAGINETRMDEILGSHVINPASLRSDDFETFFKARENALLDRIEKAMGKPVNREAITLDESLRIDYHDEEINEGEQ